MHNVTNSSRAREAERLVDRDAGGTATSAAIVYWNVGLVLAAFLGLALTVTAVLTAVGIQ